MQMTPRASRPRFLLVEDDIISRGFFKAALETLPADVDTADSLASALASAEPGAHDLWLIDVNLPDGNGAQLLRELRRSHPDTPFTPRYPGVGAYRRWRHLHPCPPA